MSQKVKFFKLWAELNREKIFSQKDCFKCFECKHSKKYEENTHSYKQLVKKCGLYFTKCQNNQCEHWKVSYSHCPYFEK